MSIANLLISIQIVLTGLLIYRIERFIRTHRTWELGLTFLIWSFLIALILINPLYDQRWIPVSLTAFLLLIALEPELLYLWNKLIRSVDPNSLERKESLLAEIIQAADALAATKTGALIALERNDSLLQFGHTGIEINADIKKELLCTLFTKDTPTHDGGVLIRKGRVTHCGAVFPLSERKQIENGLGTRHRAAIGLTEHTDAVCLVVSEEEGTISLARGGELDYAIPPRKLQSKVKKLLAGRHQPQYYPLHYVRRLTPTLVRSNFIQFSTSRGQKIYDLIVVTFWLFVLLFLNQFELFRLSNLRTPIERVLHEPWTFAPFVLFALSVGAFLLNRQLTVSAVTNQVKEETRLLILPLFRRKWSRDNLKGITLKREPSAGNVWSVAFMDKKHKTIFLDRATRGRALGDSAKKIRDVLGIELIS